MEQLMQYVWQHRLWLQQNMRTVDGRVVQVIDPGKLNTDAGPDFFNAKVIIGGKLWVGNVEIHVRASDWRNHHHEGDPAYDSVILHVVEKDDMAVQRSNGEIIPQMCMPCSEKLHAHYMELVQKADSDLPCAKDLASMPKIYVADWLSTLAYERLYRKVGHINDLLERFSGDWHSACYIVLARSLGFSTNSDAFERLALSMPLRILLKHRDSLTSVEAMLFGQAGLLDNAPADEPYVKTLKSEYDYFAKKFGLLRPSPLNWRMARIRPQNTPYRRIALLSAMVAAGFDLPGKMVLVQSTKEAADLFRIELTGFWAHHYSFNPANTNNAGMALGESSINVILINAVIPLMYAFGFMRDEPDVCDKAVAMLQSLRAERNSIVELFTRAGITCNDAFTSQALIQLRREYCETRKCLYCRIGHRMLAAKAHK